VPLQGIWTNGTYTITLNNSTNSIKDLAGNALQPNNANGVTQFVIQQVDTAPSPWQNPHNKYDVNNDGIVSGLDALQIINRLLQNQGGTLVPPAIVPPYVDVNGDGVLSAIDALQVINFLNTPVPAPTVTTAVVAAPETDTTATGGQSAAPLATSLATTTSFDAVATPPDATATAIPVSSDTQASAIAFSLSVSQSTTVAASTSGVSSTATTTAPQSARPAAAMTADDSANSPTSSAVTSAFADDWDCSTDDMDGILTDIARGLPARRLAVSNSN
jgi:hypothetical protein